MEAVIILAILILGIILLVNLVSFHSNEKESDWDYENN